MAQAKRRVFEREHNGRAWLAFHITHLPHQKPPKRLADLMIKRPEADQPRAEQSLAEMQTVMRHWAFAMAAAAPALPGQKG